MWKLFKHIKNEHKQIWEATRQPQLEKERTLPVWAPKQDTSCRLTLRCNYSLGIDSLQLPPSHPQLRKNVNRPDNLKQSCFAPWVPYYWAKFKLCVCCPLVVKTPMTLCEIKKLLFHQITSNIYVRHSIQLANTWQAHKLESLQLDNFP